MLRAPQWFTTEMRKGRQQGTVDPGNHQDDFHITPSFFSVWYGPHAHESRSEHQKIFPGADFEKNPFL